MLQYVIIKYVLDADTLVNATESLEDEETRVLDEVIQAGDQEEIIHQHGFTFPQLLLGAVKVKVHVETFEELCDRVAVGRRLLLNDLDQIF